MLELMQFRKKIINFKTCDRRNVINFAAIVQTCLGLYIGFNHIVAMDIYSIGIQTEIAFHS